MTFFRSAQSHVEQTTAFGRVRKGLCITRHDNHAVALEALGFVDRAHRFGGRLGSRMRALMSDVGEALVWVGMVAQAHSLPRLHAAIQLDVKEVGMCATQFG
jgi:hypothetical protein